MTTETQQDTADETAEVEEIETTQEASKDTKTFTQDEVNKMIEKRLSSAKAKLFKDEVEPLKAQLGTIDEIKTAAEKTATERDEAKTQAQTAAKERDRLSVALKTGLPADLVERLRGDTVEELEADATALLALVKPAKGSSGFDGGPRPAAKADDDYASSLKKAFGV